jgi:hypothetical protein
VRFRFEACLREADAKIVFAMSNGIPPKSAEPGIVRLRWPIVAVAVTLLAVAGFAFWVYSCKETIVGSLRETGKQSVTNIHAIGEEVAKGMERFKKGTITQTFTAAIPSLARSGGGNLELATATATETFTRTDRKTIAWDWISLGTTVTEIKVPVTYRYHLRLRDKWNLDVSSNTCIVYAPRIRASLPPAIHTDKMEKKSDEGWARFNAQEQMTELERSITPTLAAFAGDKMHVALVREECRKTVAEFVRDWLLREDQWRTDRFHTVKVIFEGEPAPDPERMPPTIQLR